MDPSLLFLFSPTLPLLPPSLCLCLSLTVSVANLASLLKTRFHDHQMITSRKDILGTELLSLPFRRDELEAILEDLA